jgi:protein-S-isoprenylcysteine O-methyltransferase Ste14
MDRKKQEKIIKRYQLEHLVPLALTIISVYFWITCFKDSITYYAGLIINIIGLIIWWLAKIEIGENWSGGYGKPSLKELVTTGIYSKIKHPLYWGINITLIGILLMYHLLWISIIILFIVLYFFNRMRIETIFLEKKLGKVYKEYKNSTWF